MTIKFLGHASFLITSKDRVRIITDPYEPGGFGGTFRYRPITDEADIVTVSHDHADHNYAQGVPGNPVVVTSSGEVKGIDFEVIESYHDDTQGAQRGINRVVCFEVDGIKVCHLGDLGHLLSAEQVTSVGHVDILLVPVGGTFTINPSQAAEVIAQLQPSVAIPMHFKRPEVDLPITPLGEFLVGKRNVQIIGPCELFMSASDLADLAGEQRILAMEPTN